MLKNTDKNKSGILIEDELHTDFLVYASCVNNDRAFPDVRDGLKPSQRAVCWTMYTDGYFSNKPHVKCAKISGSCIARLWPHGDVGIYETLARMSQPWLNNLCEVDFHGANGSVIGGAECANQRYTEARLSKVAEEGYFSNIRKNVVDTIPNYCEDEQWPAVLPALFPRLYINGSQGIGYTIAQEWEPHNLNELLEKVKEYLKKGSISTDNIYPDYPTGGIIINKKDLHTIYETGKGNIILRGKAEVLGNFIQITELPYQVYVEPLIQKIKDLVNSNSLTGIEDIYNKSDDNGLLIEIECSSDPALILNKLYKLTDLQVTFTANQMALVNGIPQMLNLQDYLKLYIEHNLTCLQREYTYDLNKAQARLEIVDGLVKALSIIDKIIKIIKSSKSSEEAKQNLISNFSFSENQAKAIIDMKLGKLANLETSELQAEQKELNSIITTCTIFLADSKLQQKEFLRRLTEFTKKYGWERRTEVCDINLEEEKVVVAKTPKIIEDYMISVDGSNHIKRIDIRQYKANKDTNLQTVKIAEDQKIILISNKGLLYRVPIKNIQKCNLNSAGTDLNTLINLNKNEKIIKLFTGQESEEFLFFITENGLAKKMNFEDIKNISKKIGITVMKLSDDDTIIDCRLVNSEQITVKYNNKNKIINTDKFLPKSRTAGGVCAIKVKTGLKVTI